MHKGKAGKCVTHGVDLCSACDVTFARSPMGLVCYDSRPRIPPFPPSVLSQHNRVYCFIIFHALNVLCVGKGSWQHNFQFGSSFMALRS